MLICLNDLFACLGLAQTSKLLTNFSKNSFYLLPEPLRLGYFLTNYYLFLYSFLNFEKVLLINTIMGTALFWMVPVASMLALVLAWYFYRQMMRESEGTPSMEKIASHVRRGAMSYLKQQQLRMLRHVQPMPHVHINLPRICLKAVKPDLPQ